MSEEEKELIKELERKSNLVATECEIFIERSELFTILNLIDRLQTENEKLKKLCNKATEIIDEFTDTLEEDNKKIHKYRMEKINNVGGDIE